MIKRQLKLLLAFTKKEFEGILIFLILLLLIVFSPDIYQRFNPRPEFNFEAFKKEIADFKVSSEKEKTYSYKQIRFLDKEARVKPRYFEFNPNDLPVKSWKKLGLSDKQIKVIKNYESKGGRFYKKEDLKKIYSISPEWYRQAEAYISIPEKAVLSKKFGHGFSKYPVREIQIVEINSADSARLLTVNGIGPVFASRILKYRNRLGGFYDKKQLMEVYGIDSLKYEQLKGQLQADSLKISRIDINTATFDDLKRFPYLTYKQMNAIVQYRKQHGYYKKISDLKNILILNRETLHKIRPYLNFRVTD